MLGAGLDRILAIELVTTEYRLCNNVYAKATEVLDVEIATHTSMARRKRMG